MKGEYGEILGEEEGNADYEGMVQPGQQHVAPCIKGFECGLDTRCLRMVAAFWVGIPVEVTQDQEAGLVPRCRRAAIGLRSPSSLHHLQPHRFRFLLLRCLHH